MPEAGLQPSMLPDEITAKEVRPPSKGRIVQISMEDQLKLDQARIAAEEAVENKEAYEAQAEAEGIKAYLATEPASRLTNLIKKTGWYKGEVKNLTLKQYRDLVGKAPKANILTKDKKHVKWEYALDDIATELGYVDGETLKTEIERAGEYQDRIKKLEAQVKTHFTEKPLAALPEVKPEEVAVSPTGERMLTPAQIARTLDLFGKYIADPSTFYPKISNPKILKSSNLKFFTVFADFTFARNRPIFAEFWPKIRKKSKTPRHVPVD